MAYDDSQLRRHGADVTDPLGQQQPFGGDGRDPHNLQAVHHTPGLSTYPDSTGSAVSSEDLDDVFDDEDDDRDRLGVHWTLELLLLLAVGGLSVLLWQSDAAALRGEALSVLLVVVAAVLLLGTAAAVSLRAGVPNLAIGPVAAASAVYFAQRGSEGVMVPTTVALVSAIGLGVAVAVLVAGIQVPAWAASLAAAAGVVVWLHQQPPEVALTGTFDPTGRAPAVLLAVAALSVVGGLLGTIGAVRRAVGRFRPTGDPAGRPGMLAAVSATAALVVSMALAAGAGVLLAAGEGVPVAASSGSRWFELTIVGFAVALIGGTSAFGQRGGVFGTTLAALGFVLFDRYQDAQGWQIAPLATAAVAVAVGLLITRLVERLGRPGPDDEDLWSEPPATQPETTARPADAWSPTDAWTSALPAQPAPDNPWRDRWSR